MSPRPQRHLLPVVFVFFLYFPLAGIASATYYGSSGSSLSTAPGESPKATVSQLTNSPSDISFLRSPGQESYLGEPSGIAKDVVAWTGSAPASSGSAGYSYIDQKSGALKAGSWTLPAGAAVPWSSRGYLFADVNAQGSSAVVSFDPYGGQLGSLPIYQNQANTIDYGTPVNNGTYFVTIVGVSETLQDTLTQNVQDIDTATIGSGSWATAVPHSYQEISGTCNNGLSSYDFFFQPSVPQSIFVGDQKSFAWVRENYRVGTDSTGCPLSIPTSDDIVLNAGKVVASYPIYYNSTSGATTGGASILGFWGHIILYSATESGATTYRVYDASAGTTSPTLPPGQDFCGPDAGCLFPYYYTDFQSDGNSLVWASLNSTGTGAIVYVWNSNLGLKALTETLAYGGVTTMAVGVSGQWAMWTNMTRVGQSSVGYVNFYNLQDNRHVSVQVSGFTSEIDTDAGGNYVLYDFQAGRMVWITGEYANQPGYASLHVYDLNRLEAGQNPYGDVNLNFIAGAVSGPVMITSDEIFFTAAPSNETSNGNPAPLQVFALKPPTLIPVIIIPDFARTRLDVGRNQTWPGASPPSYLTSKQKKSQLVTDFTLCGGPCGDRYKLFLNQSLPLYTPTNFSKSVKVKSIFDYRTVPLQHTPITPNGVPAINIVINKTLAKITNEYAGLENSLTSMGYQMGVNMFTMAYDWRFDNSFHYLELDRLIEIAQNDTGAYQVVLIAHGNGGLIAEGYPTSGGPRDYWINAVISIGTPFAGDPKAYYSLISGYGFGNPMADTMAMKILLQDYVSIYEQLPTQSFVISAGNTTKLPKLVTFNDLANWCAASANACLSPTQAYSISLHGFNETVYKGKTTLATVPLKQGENPETVMKNYTGSTSFSLKATKGNNWMLNGTDISSADAFISSFTGSHQIVVPTFNIVGAGVQTLSAFVMRQANSTEVKKGQYLDYYDEYSGTTEKVVLVPYFSNGDGTVPLWSEVDTDPNVLNLYFYTSSNHDKLVADRGVDSMITSILQGARTDQDLCGGTPTNCKFDAHHISKNTEKTNFVLHSDAELVVNYTGDGSTFGLNMFGGVDENVSRGSFADMQGVEYATVNNATSPLAVSVNGTTTGDFTLDVSLQGANNATYAYQGIPVTNGSLSQLTLNPITASASHPPALTTISGSSTYTNTGGNQNGAPGSGAPLRGWALLFAVPVVVVVILAVGAFLYRSRRRRLRNK